MEIKGKRTDNNIVYYKIRSIWKSMMARCYNENNHAYKNYGHKNIKVCKRWHNLNNFIKDFDKILIMIYG